MYISKIELRNFRIFDEVGITVYFQKGINAIISENNSGKSAIVDALRIAFSTVPYKKDIFFNLTDFHIRNDGTRCSEAYISIYFNELPADLFEIWNPEDPTKGEFHIRYSTVNTPQGMEKVRYKIWGGPAEGNAVSPETFEAIQLVFLGALRDVETEMRPMKTSRLASLFGSVTNTPESRNEIIDVLRKANDDILGKQSVKKVREIVNDNLSTIEQDILRQHIELGLVEPKFDSIAASLRAWLKPRWFFLSKDVSAFDTIKNTYTSEEWEQYATENENGAYLDVIALRDLNKPVSEEVSGLLQRMSSNSFELFQNGLGYNNILFMSTVLGDMKTGTEDLFYSLLLVEEPEAHLHPQLQELVHSFFQKNAERENMQVIFTSHSPTLVSRVGIDRITLLYESCHRIDCLSLSQSNLSDEDRNNLERYLDVTKSQMLFAKGIIFVEGISEAILMPIFAEYVDRPLGKYAVEVVNVDGVAFKPFANLLCYANDTGRQTIKAAIVTDDDRCTNRADPDHYISKEIDYDTTALESVVEKLKYSVGSERFQSIKEMCDESHVNLWRARKTFEYELVLHENNIPYLLNAIAQSHPRAGAALSEIVSKLETLEEKAACIWLFVRDRSQYKGEIAQNLARRLKIDLDILQGKIDGEVAKPFVVPDYIRSAIFSVTKEG